MPAQIFVAPTQRGVSIQIVGKGSMAESAAVKDVAIKILKSDPPASVEVDLSRCDYLDSTLLGCLITIHRAAAGKWQVIAPEAVRTKVLSPTRLDQVLPIVDTPSPLVGEPVRLEIGASRPDEQAHHVYECHAHLAEVDSPQRATFVKIAEQMKRELKV